MHDNPFQSPASVEFQPPNPAWRVPWGKIVFWLVVLFVLAALLLPIMSRGRGQRAAIQSACLNHVFKISKALQAYHDEHGTFPPAYTVDAAGKPLHSWRTLLLPYIDEEALYKTIDLTKPWDDPVNAKARQTVVDYYQCPYAPAKQSLTNYLAVVTPTSCLRPGKSATKAEITDDPAKTVMIIEVPEDKAVPWMSPHDVDENFFVNHIRGDANFDWPHFHVVFVAGNIQAIDPETPAVERRAMITTAGGD